MMEKYLYVALFAPLVGSLFSALFTAQKKNVITGLVTSALLLITFVSSLTLMFAVHEGLHLHVKMMEWISAGNLELPFGFTVDNVSVIMMVTVSLVSTVVNIYSMGYMAHDAGYNRFFTYISAFVFSMLILVMSDNFVGLFIGWEGVGLCSWMLIGFWYKKHSASWAANEAFIMNRVADLGMLMGLFLIYWQFGSFSYSVCFCGSCTY
jgi:NADH-quinone oxidoreductase subunit L